MKKLIFVSLILHTFVFAKLNTVVTILPEQTFLKAIGGNRVNVALMVLPGNSPHTYEPKPSQMRDIAKADLYFKIGVEFEKVWLGKFQTLNPAMQTIDLSEHIEKRAMLSHLHHKHHDALKDRVDEDTHREHSNDPHIWTAPSNVALIAENIYQALSQHDPKNKAYYKRNLVLFNKKIIKTDNTIKEILSKIPKGSRFMVFHPSWGYFAHAYNLEQLPIEIEGKTPKPKELIHIIKEAREEKVKAIFTQPEFSDSMAKVIAKELGIKVVKVSPLDPQWSENLINIAHAIADKE